MSLLKPELFLTKGNSLFGWRRQRRHMSRAQVASYADALWARHATRVGGRMRDEPKERLRGRLALRKLFYEFTHFARDTKPLHKTDYYQSELEHFAVYLYQALPSNFIK